MVLLVSTSPCCRASCAMILALLGVMRVRARKSSPSTRKMAQNGRFMACWAKFFAVEHEGARCRANFFAEMPVEAPCWASFFAEEPLEGQCWVNFFSD